VVCSQTLRICHSYFWKFSRLGILWSLSYSCNIQVCERSLKNTQNGPSMPPVQHFVRAEMLPSGYLVRPCEGGGSIIHIVDHMDLEVGCAGTVLFFGCTISRFYLTQI
jgi:hypothetical protein